jgi:hypothetical protein
MTGSIDITEFRPYIRQLRQAVADYMRSEGCSCCRGDNHDAHKEVIAELLGVQKYSDGSGYDFRPYQTAEERNDDEVAR